MITSTSASTRTSTSASGSSSSSSSGSGSSSIILAEGCLVDAELRTVLADTEHLMDRHRQTSFTYGFYYGFNNLRFKR